MFSQIKSSYLFIINIGLFIIQDFQNDADSVDVIHICGI